MLWNFVVGFMGQHNVHKKYICKIMQIFLWGNKLKIYPSQPRYLVNFKGYGSQLQNMMVWILAHYWSPNVAKST